MTELSEEPDNPTKSLPEETPTATVVLKLGSSVRVLGRKKNGEYVPLWIGTWEEDDNMYMATIEESDNEGSVNGPDVLFRVWPIEQDD